VYRDSKCIVNFRTMTFYDTTDQALYKLRRETAICSKMIRLGQGTWSFYNGLTWIQYDRFVTIQLEEKLRHGEVINGCDGRFNFQCTWMAGIIPSTLIRMFKCVTHFRWAKATVRSSLGNGWPCSSCRIWGVWRSIRSRYTSRRGASWRSVLSST
jgi:hypothetical protein